MGMANTMAAWATGISRFDTCLGGIGGCPHAPGASGNVATEDAAYLFASMGVATGVDFDALIALRAQLAQWLDGEPLHGNIWRAGLPKTMFELTTPMRRPVTAGLRAERRASPRLGLQAQPLRQASVRAQARTPVRPQPKPARIPAGDRPAYPPGEGLQ